MDLFECGWNPSLEESFALFRSKNWMPARVISGHFHSYTVWSEVGELSAAVAGRMRYQAHMKSELPVVGDWVAITPLADEGKAIIHGITPRTSKISRKAAGIHTEEQVLAANIDSAFLLIGLDHDFNLRRLERYLTQFTDNGVEPIVVLNKADLCDNVGDYVQQVAAGAPRVAMHVVSALQNTGTEALQPYLTKGRTVILIGSSGAGKSTLINAFLGVERQKTGELRLSDGRGKHTTTKRELIFLPSGGVLIDTPGLRELQLWGEEESLASSFEDIESMIGECRFSDCRHSNEPGCAVREALERGDLDPKRYENYLKLRQEFRSLSRRQIIKAKLSEKAKLTARINVKQIIKEKRSRIF